MRGDREQKKDERLTVFFLAFSRVLYGQQEDLRWYVAGYTTKCSEI